MNKIISKSGIGIIYVFISLLLMGSLRLVYEDINYIREVNGKENEIEYLTQPPTYYNISYENGMEKYITDEYFKHYPNETGLCLEARIENLTVIIYNISEEMIVKDRKPNSVRVSCPNPKNSTIEFHTHPREVCYPSKNDKSPRTTKTKYGLIACGTEDKIKRVFLFEPEEVN